MVVSITLVLALALLIVSVVLAVIKRDTSPSLFALWAIGVAIILGPIFK